MKENRHKNMKREKDGWMSLNESIKKINVKGKRENNLERRKLTKKWKKSKSNEKITSKM